MSNFYDYLDKHPKTTIFAMILIWCTVSDFAAIWYPATYWDALNFIFKH